MSNIYSNIIFKNNIKCTPMRKPSEINEINCDIEEGKLLLAAISKITTESQTDKTPDQVLAQLHNLVDKIDFQ